MAKLADINEKIAETVVDGYKSIKKGAVDGFNKVSDKCIDVFFTKEGETVEEAKERLNNSKNYKGR